MGTWIWLLAACSGTATTDSGATATDAAAAWTQADLTCVLTAHHWAAWATGLHGHAQLRLVPALADGSWETHPLVVDDADPAGTWTLFTLDLEVDLSEVSPVPGRVTAHGCRGEGSGWTWALDLLDGEDVVACTAGQAADTGVFPENVATCDLPK